MRSIDAEHYLLEVRLKRERVPSFGQYPFSLPAVRNLQKLELHPKVTFIIGENGSGKSTLLEAIAVAWGFNPEGGSRNFRFSTRRSHSVLHEYLAMAKSFKRAKDGFFLRAESFYNVATEIERLDEEGGGPPIIDSYGGVSLHEQSHGESFFALMMNRFGGNGLYILDEPEAALSPSRQLAMLARIHQLVQSRSQFVVATHSPILMAGSTPISRTLQRSLMMRQEECHGQAKEVQRRVQAGGCGSDTAAGVEGDAGGCGHRSDRHAVVPLAA